MQQVQWGVSHGREAGPEKYPLVINGGDPAAGGAQQKEEPQPPVGEEGVLNETSDSLLTSRVLFLDLLLCSVSCVEVLGWGRAFGAEEPGKGIYMELRRQLSGPVTPGGAGEEAEGPARA